MWVDNAQNTLRFRNALALLQAGGYDVDLHQDRMLLRTARTGREWLCETLEDFDTACAFHAWEAMGRPSVPRRFMAWTDAVSYEPSIQRALNTFYENGYAVRIARGRIDYVDRMGCNWAFWSRDEFIAGAAALGSEHFSPSRSLPSSGNAGLGVGGGPERPPVNETRDSKLKPTAPMAPSLPSGEMAALAKMRQRLVSMEARATAAERRAAELVNGDAGYQQLKAALLTKYDPARGRAGVEEKNRRNRMRAWLLRLCNTIEGAAGRRG
jgi:hypothetical protein